MAEIPSSLLICFFQEAASSMAEYESEECVCSLSVHRKALLQVQLSCLSRVVANYDSVTVEQVQNSFKDLGASTNMDTEVREAMQAMNEAARVAFCRLVLHDECRWNSTKTPPRTLNRGEKPMSRADLVEYAGLCNGVVRLPNFQKHLKDGSKLFYNVETPSPMFAQKRLDRIQELLLRAIGFDIDFGKKEIARYYQGDEALDTELTQLLNQLSSNMTVALTNASLEGTLSDQDTGGVTRVVSVSYSEKIVSPDGREISTTSAPAHESIREQVEDQQLLQLKMARQAASLEQSILDDLLALSEEDRLAKLEMAKQAHDDFVTRAMELPSGPERISFLTSVDPDTQRLLLIHKLWTKKLEENDGKVSATQ